MNKEQAIAAHMMRVEMGEFTHYRLTCNLGDDAECHQTCETHPEGGCGMAEETCVKAVYSGGCVIAEWVNDGGIEFFWSITCLGIATYLRQVTGLPIDYQIQRMTEANAKHTGVRNPIGTRARPYAGGGDATNFTANPTKGTGIVVCQPDEEIAEATHEGGSEK
jgi:hypothetical protein